ncbi:Hypothetical protein HDN1F_03380 [gamma proteobacterium HdN1]|nr:Hypothetical protein HDN1F_03380 [gamma proteobacterium HdN1]
MSRIILLAAIGFAVYYIYKKLAAKKLAAQQASNESGRAQVMLKCAQCDVHVPKQEAISSGSLHFCSESHKNLYLKDHHS